MATKKTPTKPVDPLVRRCPECGSAHVGGLMQAFWVPLQDDDSPDGDWNDWNGDSELGAQRMCYDCEHEWCGD